MNAREYDKDSRTVSLVNDPFGRSKSHFDHPSCMNEIKLI